MNPSILTLADDAPEIAPAMQAIHKALQETDDVDLSTLNLATEPNPWTMDIRTLQFLAAIVGSLRPNRIVEFGSGLSTQVLAAASIQAGTTCSLFSLDHDPEYGQLDIARSLTSGTCVSAAGLLAPLVLREFAGNLYPAYCYAEQAIADYLPADLIVVDAPPVLLGGRKGTLFQAMNMARPGTLLLLDDAHRDNERESIAEWQRFFGNAIDVHMLTGFPKGLAAILIRKPVSSQDSLDYHRRMVLESACKSIPEDQRFAVLDDHYFASEPLFQNQIEQNAVWANDGGPESPVDDESATRYLETLRERGVAFLVVTWPAFWWLEHFGDFATYLRTHFVLLKEDSRAQVFNVRRNG